MAGYAPVDQDYQGGYNAAAAKPPKKPISNWIKFGVPVFVLVVIAAVLGGVLGSRAAKNNNSSASGSNQASSASASAAASAAASAKNEIGRFATSTESDYMMPVYPSTVRFIHPLLLDTSKLELPCGWGADLRLLNVRRTPRRSLPLLSILPPTPTSPGPRTPSNPPTQARLPSAPIVPASSPPPTNGPPSRL